MSAEIIQMPPAAIAEREPAPGALAQVLHLVRIGNPLSPTVSRREESLPWVQFKTTKAYLEEAYPLGFELMTVSLNGRVLTAVEMEHVLPRAGDYLVVSPSIEGGSVWRTLAEVGVMAAAIAATYFLGPAGYGLMSSTMASLVGGAVAIGGNLLINTFMSLNPASRAQQPSWAFGGPHTLASPGVVIPKGYGTFRSGGNVIASFVDIEGSNQYINALVCYGFGPARSIFGLQINGKDIGTYQNVQYSIRYGANDQTAIPAFNRIINGYPQQVQVLNASGPVTVPGTGTQTQALQVDIQFPVGVYYVSGAGNNLPCKVVYKVEYAVSGSGVWAPVLQPRTTQNVVKYHGDGTVDWSLTPKWVLLWNGAPAVSGIVLHGDNGPHTPGDQQTVTQTIVTYEADGSHTSASQNFTGEWQPIDVSLNQVEVTDWMNGWVQYVNDTTQAVYNRTSIYGLPPNKYDIRVTKYGSNNADNTVLEGDYDSPRRGQEVWIHSVNEITYQDLNYPNMILIGVRALATNQLSGSDINITALITYGLRTLDNNLLPAALQAFEEDNPACVAADMMLDPLYGGGAYPGILPTNIERFIDEWVAWAENNDTLAPDGNGNSIRICVFNGIFDNEDNLWNQVQAVGRMSRACVVPMGRDYGVFVNGVDSPVQLFSVGNIVQDSFEETWLALDDRANQIEVEFTDATRYYKTDNPMVYADPVDMAAGSIVKNVRVRGTGITSPAQAWIFGQFLGVCNKLLLRTGKFQCDVDAIACRPGNLVILQHDVPQWGWGGRTLPGSKAAKVNLDRSDLPWDGVTAYNVIALFPSIQRYTGTVTSVANDIDSSGLTIGTLVGLSSFDNAHRVTRAIINGVDCAILSAQVSLVLVTLPPGFTPAIGQAYKLYDTDVMETATVAGVAPGPNNTSIVTLGTPFTQDPEDFSTYFYGQPGSQKIVRVTSIRKASEFKAAIEWIDYDPNCYALRFPVVKLVLTILPGFAANVTFSFAGGGGSGASASAAIASTTSYALQLSGGSGYFSAPTVTSSDPAHVTAIAIIGPQVGETSAQITTNPGVTDLVGGETFLLDTAGNYLDYIVLSWKNGPNTEGVGIYGSYPGLATPRELARLTGRVKNWRFQATPGVVWTLTVVGFDANGVYAPFTTAPSVTVAAEGITANLLQDSSFQSGFAYWNVTPRAGDTLVPTFANDGEAAYTVNGSAISSPSGILSQAIPPSKWAVGELLMISAYFEVTGTPTGYLVADAAFTDSTGATISVVRSSFHMVGASQSLIRVNSAATAIPAGTVAVTVRVFVDTSPLLPVGTVIKVSHLLLEIASVGQTVPSVWADIDASGKVLDVFELGSSSSLRVQGSALPTYTGSFPYTYTDTTITLAWLDLAIQWPDGGLTEVMDGTIGPITGLAPTTYYYAYLYFDVVNGGVKAVVPASAVGTPALLSTSLDAAAAAACRQDGRVPLTGLGLLIITAGTGGSGSGASSGGVNAVVVTPGHATLSGPGGTQAFTATVTLGGVVGGSVTWRLGPGSLGSIDSFGNYTGPGGSGHGGASIIATAVADPSVMGGAGVSW
jgi:hypothetical protein